MNSSAVAHHTEGRKARRGSAARRILWMILAVVTLSLVFFVVAMGLWNRTHPAPKLSILGPLPSSAEIVLNESVQGGGSAEQKTRLVVLSFKGLRSAEEGMAAILEPLRAQGWKVTSRNAAIDSKSGACISLDSASGFFVDDSRDSEEKRLIRAASRKVSSSTVVVASVLFC